MVYMVCMVFESVRGRNNVLAERLKYHVYHAYHAHRVFLSKTNH